MEIAIRTSSFSKNYLVDTFKYDFESSLSLILELFSSHHFIDKEVELYLYQLLGESNYSSIDDIPILQLNTILDYFLEHRDNYKVNYDEERLSYLLLAAIKKDKIIFTIDNMKVLNLEDAVKLKEDSVINFFKIEKLKTITFKTV